MPLVSRGKCAASVKRQVCHPRGKFATQEASVPPKRQVCHPRGKCASQEASVPPQPNPTQLNPTQEPSESFNKEKKKKLSRRRRRNKDFE